MLKKIFVGIWIVQILSTFLSIAGMLIDSLVIGKFLGEQSMAAYGLISPILLIFTSVSGAIAVGAMSIAGDALGRGDMKKANQRYMSALAMAVGSAVIFALVFIVFAGNISMALGGAGNEGLLSEMTDYMRGYVIGIPGIAFLMISLPFTQLNGDKKRPTIAAAIKTGCDITIDLLVVLVFKEGMFYIGLGSAVSAYLAAIYIMFFFIKPTSMFRLKFANIRVSEFGGILKNGLPNTLSVVLWTCMMLVMNRLALNNGGVTSVAALTITMSVFNFLVVNGNAAANAVAMMTATYSAEYDYDAIKKIFYLGLKFSFFGNLLVSGLAFIFAGPIASLFSDGNPAVIACAITGIRFICVRNINCPCSVIRNVFLGMKRLRVTRIMTICSSFVTLALPAILFANFWGMNGVWLSFVTSDIFLMIGLYIAFSLRKGHIVPALEDYLLPSGEGSFAVEDSRSYSVRSVEEVISASEQVAQMCKEHEENLKTRLHTSLAIEEHGVNVITHGFDGQMAEDSFFEIRAFYKNGNLTISMKDNAKAFDPTKFVSSLGDETTTDNIGLRLLMSNAKEVKYTYTFGHNCILVEMEKTAVS